MRNRKRLFVIAGCVCTLAIASCGYESPTAPTVVNTPPPAPAPSPAAALPATTPALPPAAITVGFNVAPYNPHTDELIAITLEATNGTAPLTYAWTFSDGGQAAGSAPTHAFHAEGVQTIRVTATDATGRTGSGYREIEVHREQTRSPSVPAPPPTPPAPPPPPPAPTLTVSLTCSAMPHGTDTACNVNASYGGVLLPSAAITRVDWDWGDWWGNPNGGIAATHLYTIAGAYFVFATVTATTVDGSKTVTTSKAIGVL